MRHDLQQTLYERYPALFTERFGTADETGMARGIECPDGWFGLLDTLCATLQESVDMCLETQVVVTLVKEKFGRLRFQVRSGASSDHQRGMICFAESLSLRTCPLCGNLDCTTHAPLETRASYIAKRLARRSATGAPTVAQRERCHRLNLHQRDIKT